MEKPDSKKNNTETNEQPWIYLNTNGKVSVNCSTLACYINSKCHYIIVRKQGFDNEILYWFENGFYKRMSPNEFKGKIKTFIPEDIRKSSHWEETYKHLITNKSEIKYDDLNPIEHLICFKNGVYSVNEKKLIKYDPKYLQTIQLNTYYNQSFKKPELWINFISSLCNYDKELISLIQEWAGLIVSNYNGFRTKKCLALYGTVGNTGKTVFINIIREILGQDNISSTAIQDLSTRFGASELYGKRANLIDDQKSMNIDDSSIFKSLTGGGGIKVELKGKQAFSFIYKGIIAFATNDLPFFSGDKGDHIWERFSIIPCDNVIPENKRDPTLLDKLKKEKDNIVMWSIEGLERLVKNNFRFTYSSRSADALEEYRSNNDSFYKFIKANYVITRNENDKVRKNELEAEYTTWCEDESILSLDKRNIKARAAKHGIQLKRMKDTVYYRGIARINEQIILHNNS